MIDLHPLNPWRPYDWRWRTALLLAERPFSPAVKFADDGVHEAVRFVTALHKCRGDTDRQELAARMPALFQAHELWCAMPQERRWAVEARVLADEPVEAIANKHGLDGTAVHAYEQCFFAVRHKLQASDYIMCSVVGEKAYLGLTERDLDVIWKMFGYLYGPLMLDRVIPITLGPIWVAPADHLADLLDEDVHFALRVKMVIAVRMPADTPGSLLAVLRLYLRMRELEAKQSGKAASSRLQEQRMTALLSSLAAPAVG